MDELPLDLDLLLRRRGWLRKLARGLVGEGEVDDLLQESWLAALRARTRPRSSLAAWFTGLARNAARGLRRERAGDAAPEASDPRPSLAEALAQAELQERLIAAVRALREPYRTTVLLRYFEGLSLEEVARRTGVPGSTARSRLARALAELRERLGGGREHSAWALVVALARGDGSGTWLGTGVTWMGATAKVAATVGLGAVAVIAVWRMWADGSDPAARAEPSALGLGEPRVVERHEPHEDVESVSESERTPAEPPSPRPSAPVPPAPASASTATAPTELERELERTAESFLTARPDAAGLLDLAARLADEVLIVEESIRTDAFGSVSGELVLGGLQGNFSIQRGRYAVSLESSAAGEAFLSRDLQVHFSKRGPEDPARGGSVLVSFHPASTPEAQERLGHGERYSGWHVSVDPLRGASASPLSMTALDAGGELGWTLKVGSAVNLPSLDLPWVQDQRAFERWAACLEEYATR